MQRGSPARGEDCRGIAAVELALVVPLLVFILVASVDFARISYYQMALDGCARNGALYAQLTTGDPVSPYSSLQLAALADATPTTADNGLTPAPTVAVGYSSVVGGPFTETTPSSPGFVQVKVEWTFATLVRYPGIPSLTTLKSVCLMPVPPAAPLTN